MEFLLLLAAILLAMGAHWLVRRDTTAALAFGAHWLVRRDTTAALAFGAGLFVFALVPLLAAQYGGR